MGIRLLATDLKPVVIIEADLGQAPVVSDMGGSAQTLAGHGGDPMFHSAGDSGV